MKYLLTEEKKKLKVLAINKKGFYGWLVLCQDGEGNYLMVHQYDPKFKTYSSIVTFEKQA